MTTFRPLLFVPLLPALALVVGCDDPHAGGPTAASAARVAAGPTTAMGVDRAVVLLPPKGSFNHGFGDQVAGLGDVDDDGFGDVAVSAPQSDGAQVNAGEVVVLYGDGPGLAFASREVFFPPVAGSAAASLGYGGGLAGPGDVNGDGYMDVWVATRETSSTVGDSGAAYLLRGGQTGVDAVQLGFDASDGTATDRYGDAVSAAGDLNDDGFRDLLVGAPLALSNSTVTGGAAYVLYGSPAGPALEDKVTPLTGLVEGMQFGDALHGGEDIDGDGFDDLIVGARTRTSEAGALSGGAWVFYGGVSGWDGSREDFLEPTPPTALRQFGQAVLVAGDVDADGFADVVVTEAALTTDAGVVQPLWVFFGAATGIDAASGVRLEVPYGDEPTGDRSVLAGPGDLNGDGYADVAVGVPAADDEGVDSGVVYVLYGSETGLSALRMDRLTAPTPAAGQAFGHSVSATGDVDGDGFRDLLVGAPGDGTVGPEAGAAVLFLGGCVDVDADGFCAHEECGDTDAAVGPEALEIAGDGIDQNCDGMELCLQDADGDGVVAEGEPTVVSDDLDCDDPGEANADAPTGDCDDGDATVLPGATDVAGDGVDQDCDGEDGLTEETPEPATPDPGADPEEGGCQVGGAGRGPSQGLAVLAALLLWRRRAR